MQEAGLIQAGCSVEDQGGDWYVLKELLS